MKVGTNVPDVALAATNLTQINLSAMKGIGVVYAYPRTSPPDAAPIEGWDQIPGARGCTPQSCEFRDHYAALLRAGASYVFGMSTQSTAYQCQVVARLHLPFPLLSDDMLKFSSTLAMPTFSAGGMLLLERQTLILRDGKISHAMYPISAPERNAADVLAYLKDAMR